MSPETFAKLIFEQLERDSWGTIEPDDFTPDGEYYNDMLEVLRNALSRIEC